MMDKRGAPTTTAPHRLTQTFVINLSYDNYNGPDADLVDVAEVESLVWDGLSDELIDPYIDSREE